LKPDSQPFSLSTARCTNSITCQNARKLKSITLSGLTSITSQRKLGSPAAAAAAEKCGHELHPQNLLGTYDAIHDI